MKDSDGLRKAVEEVQPENVKLGLRLSQSKALYAAFKVRPADQGAESKNGDRFSSARRIRA